MDDAPQQVCWFLHLLQGGDAAGAARLTDRLRAEGIKLPGATSAAQLARESAGVNRRSR